MGTTQAASAPIRIINKREKIKNYRVMKFDGSQVEFYCIQAYQKSGSKSNNSGPSGKRWKRFYPDRAWSQVLGKGFKKLRDKLGLPC